MNRASDWEGILEALSSAWLFIDRVRLACYFRRTFTCEHLVTMSTALTRMQLISRQPVNKQPPAVCQSYGSSLHLVNEGK